VSRLRSGRPGAPCALPQVASAFPANTEAHKNRGIDNTEWIRIYRVTYDACLDRREYRPRA